MEKQLPLTSQQTEKQVSVLDLLKIISPGTTIRNAVDDIVRARLGALIVLYTEKLHEILEGGFRINSRLTHQRLVELCKMDGAVILSNDRKRILQANTLLVPDKNIPTNETGTRHKAAERTAKQAETLTIAVSERKNTVTLYYKNLKYVLKRTDELMIRATEILQITEKQREIYDSLVLNLNISELTDLTIARDVCNILKRIETMRKITEKISRYVLELGTEGSIIKMRLKELTLNIEETEKDIIRDYSSANLAKIRNHLSLLSFDDLLDLQNISIIIFSLTQDEKIIPKGFRFLRKTSLSEEQIKKFVKEFKNLNAILNADEELLKKVLPDEEAIKKFISEREKIKEQILL